ncbi:leucine-rich repeat-containing protein 51-like isoform X2 [Clavelina lepadiformis]|uniref:leucine-rich repeat-containing protein 51-like isoform X2 n=1 Tax=Clavelina lepadiformis TaxID=159417 RepID=UPI0040435951
MGDEGKEYKHYEVESVTSKRYSIGEVLANMKGEQEDEFDHKTGPPVDYSFRELRKMSDIARATPRDGPHPYVTIPVELPEQVTAPSVTPSGQRNDNADTGQAQKKYVKYCSKALRLSNNLLSSFDGFSKALQAVVDSPDTLEWIDLSFNDLTNISEALVQYKMVKVLYLHANVIDDMRQIDKLAALPNLKTLTLHGNMIDNAKGYSNYQHSIRITFLYFVQTIRHHKNSPAAISRF